MTHGTSSAAPVVCTADSAPTAVTAAASVEPTLVDGIDVDAVARAVRACAGVSDLFAGRFGEIGTYLPGRRIAGVQVDATALTVQIVARWGYTVRDLFAQTAGVTGALRRGRALHLVVADIADGDEPTPSAVAPPRALAPASSRPSLPESSSS